MQEDTFRGLFTAKPKLSQDYPELDTLRYRCQRVAEYNAKVGIRKLRRAIGGFLSAIVRREGGLDGPFAQELLNRVLVDASCAVRGARRCHVEGYAMAFAELHDRFEFFLSPTRRRFWSQAAQDVARYPAMRRSFELPSCASESRRPLPACGPLGSPLSPTGSHPSLHVVSTPSEHP